MNRRKRELWVSTSKDLAELNGDPGEFRYQEMMYFAEAIKNLKKNRVFFEDLGERLEVTIDDETGEEIARQQVLDTRLTWGPDVKENREGKMIREALIERRQQPTWIKR